MISPITPPFELMNQWYKKACKDPYNGGKFVMSQVLKDICNSAAQWGWDQRGAANEAELQQRADQELEACLKWLKAEGYPGTVIDLRAARRPKPPREADIALADLDALVADLSNHGMGFKTTNLRRALERLKELEASND